MKNLRLVLLVIIASLSVTSQAGYLVWEIGSEPTLASEYNGARVIARDGDGNEQSLQLYTQSGRLIGDEGEALVGVTYFADLGSTDWGSYTFFIELVNYNYPQDDANYVKGLSEERTYGSLSSSIASELSVTPESVWQGSGYAVPEPTSGLLVMIGLGLAGLWRRRNAVA